MLLRRAKVAGRVVDVQIRDGLIAAIAPGLDAGGAETVDLDGREVLPGFWDEHVHVVQAALASMWTPLGGAAIAAEALQRIALAVDASPGDEPVVGIGFQDGLWPDPPTLAAIDRVAGERTVVLISHDVHAVWLSSAAARRFGVHPGADGLLREAPAFAVGRAVNALAAARVQASIEALMHRASSLGVVGIVDFEMAWSRDAWRERMAKEWQGPRIEAAVYPPDLDRAVAAGLGTGDPVEGTGGLLAVGPLKTLIDGALNTRTAFTADPYPDGSHGLLTVAPEQLRVLLLRARSGRLTPAVHAIGDAAITAALDAFERTGTRGRIEHAQLVAAGDLPRFAALGVTASVQPAHLLDDRDVAAEHWPGRTARAYPFRSLLDAGATLAFGSDAPVAPLDPWRALRAAVERALPGEEPWHPEQRMTPGAALRASTRGRASIAVGEPADLVVLDQPVDRLDRESVAMTLVGGRVTYSR